jgi:glucosyl-dolichyl phosphate glucuronosyltransferase
MITTILCTYNRARSLAATLESLAASELPASVSWEVLVVDNNSTDQTRELVQDFCRRYPGRFRYLFEAKPGKSYALNAGIAGSLGDVLAFVDDDVIVDTRWLQNITADLTTGAWIGTAGRVLPAQMVALPSWLPQEGADPFKWDPLAVLCARFDLGNYPVEVDLNRAPYGANMAFRKCAFEKYGGFRLDLGPRPGSQIRGEDVELGQRLILAGERLRYEPSAIVYHPIPEGRIEKAFFLSWWFDFGRVSIRTRGDRPNVWGIPYDFLSLMRRVIAIAALSFRELVTPRASTRFSCKCMVRKEIGMSLELLLRLFGGHSRNVAAVPKPSPEPEV